MSGLVGMFSKSNGQTPGGVPAEKPMGIMGMLGMAQKLDGMMQTAAEAAQESTSLQRAILAELQGIRLLLQSFQLQSFHDRAEEPPHV